MNSFSAKILIDRDFSGDDDDQLEELRLKINENLPKDVKIFTLIIVANKFNAKNCTSFREYSYFLPTFMLNSISDFYLVSPPKTAQQTEEEKKEQDSKVQHVTQMSSGIKKIIRQSGTEDEEEKESLI